MNDPERRQFHRLALLEAIGDFLQHPVPRRQRIPCCDKPPLLVDGFAQSTRVTVFPVPVIALAQLSANHSICTIMSFNRRVSTALINKGMQEDKHILEIRAYPCAAGPSPGESTAHGLQQHQVALLHPSVPNSHRQLPRMGSEPPRYCRADRRLSPLLRRNMQLMGRRIDDSLVGLVRNEPVTMSSAVVPVFYEKPPQSRR